MVTLVGLDGTWAYGSWELQGRGQDVTCLVAMVPQLPVVLWHRATESHMTVHFYVQHSHILLLN